MGTTGTLGHGIVAFAFTLSVAACGARVESNSESSGAGADVQQSGAGSAGSTNAPAREGEIAITVFPDSRVAIGRLHYFVTQPPASAVAIQEGDLTDIPEDGPIAFRLVLPVRTDYQLTVGALPLDSSSDVECVALSEPFSVKRGLATEVAVTLGCSVNDHGLGGVTVGDSACPRLVFRDLKVEPPGSSSAGQRPLSTQAIDLDGKKVTYEWEVKPDTVATLAPKTGSTSALTCVGSGPVIVTVTASNGECAADASATIDCSQPTD